MTIVLIKLHKLQSYVPLFTIVFSHPYYQHIAPHILQPDNGREFTANAIKELKDMWPDCSIVHGKPRHTQSQGSVDRGNADIKEL
jgi:hypothetical protein